MTAKHKKLARTGRCAMRATCLLLILGLSWTHAYGASSSYIGDDALLDKLRDKGVLTEDEYKQLMDAETPGEKVLKFLGGISIGTLSYFDFSVGDDPNGEFFNQFLITRCYIVIKKQLTPWLGFRITPDLTLE